LDIYRGALYMQASAYSCSFFIGGWRIFRILWRSLSFTMPAEIKRKPQI